MPEPDPNATTHYTLLGVQPTASPQQIRRAFRDRSKLYHPDTTELPASIATEKFQQLNEAYAVLSSPERRWTYDKQIGYSRLSVVQPLEPLYKTSDRAPRPYRSNLYLDPTDRPLSAGEIFALFILGLTFVACLVLVVTIGFTRGETGLDPAAAVEELGQTPVLMPTEQLSSPTPSPGFSRTAPQIPDSPPPDSPTPDSPTEDIPLTRVQAPASSPHWL